MLRYKALDKEQKFELRLERLVARIDREKVWRVVSNLISSVIKFSVVGGTIEIELKKRDEFVQFFLGDLGIGIPANYKNLIFNSIPILEEQAPPETNQLEWGFPFQGKSFRRTMADFGLRVSK